MNSLVPTVSVANVNTTSMLSRMRHLGLIGPEISNDAFIEKIVKEYARKGGQHDTVVDIVEYSKLNREVGRAQMAVGRSATVSAILGIVAEDYPKALRLSVGIFSDKFTLYPRTGEVFRWGQQSKEPFCRVPPSDLIHMGKYTAWLKERVEVNK